MKNRRFTTRCSRVETLECRILLATNVFIQHSLAEEPDVSDFCPGFGPVSIADLDGDLDLDLLISAHCQEMTWYSNTNGKAGFERQPRIAKLGDITSLTTSDLDGDGDVDILTTSYWGINMSWYENTDSKGTFGAPHFVPQEGTGAETGDIDGDGKTDIVAFNCDADSCPDGGSIVWYRNIDGSTFDSPRTIAARVTADSVQVSDIDGDGDLDVVAEALDGFDNQVAWYENTDGRGTFGEPSVIASGLENVKHVSTNDIDNDGDQDVLYIYHWNNVSTIALHHNLDGKGTFGAKEILASESAYITSIDINDLDSDRDQDILVTSSACFQRDCDGEVAWLENTGEMAAFTRKHIVTSTNNRTVMAISEDIDNDGDTDIVLSSVSQLFWLENRIVGDANNDGKFDSGDLVKVFQAGKYEDDIQGNTTFDEGDWNGDGDFDTADLVLAFQAGHYVTAATTDSSELAAAVELIFDRAK